MSAANYHSKLKIILPGLIGFHIVCLYVHPLEGVSKCNYTAHTVFY